MERFYGADYAVELTNDEAEQLLRSWLSRASELDGTLAAWFEERLSRRPFGCRAFRIAPAPEPIADPRTLDAFAALVASDAELLCREGCQFLGRALGGSERRRWLARALDLLAFVNEARNAAIDADAPAVPTADALDVMIRRMWARFTELARRENYMFPDNPRYPAPTLLLDYLDQILALAESDGREKRRQWPFPKILWEREILLEKLERYDELAETMRRSAALEGDDFKRATEAYIETLA